MVLYKLCTKLFSNLKKFHFSNSKSEKPIFEKKSAPEWIYITVFITKFFDWEKKMKNEKISLKKNEKAAIKF